MCMRKDENPEPEFEFSNMSEEEYLEMMEDNFDSLILDEMGLRRGDYFREGGEQGVVSEVINIDLQIGQGRFRFCTEFRGEITQRDLAEIYRGWRRGDIVPVKVTYE